MSRRNRPIATSPTGNITNLGLWIPLVNVGESLHIVSTRVGNYQWHPAYGLLLSQL